MATILFTGFPGFLGSELLPRVLARADEDEVVCLVQGKYRDLAEERRRDIQRAHPGLAGRINLVAGDITEPDLGLGDDACADSVKEIYHLAAVYDLGVRRDVGMRVNVDGTRHVLDFAGECGALERLHYVSTCYVSGRYAGIYTEDDLDRGQRFNNYYEETKFLAEVEVQRAMRTGLPATVYRPAIVVGDSRTGATQKYDGPYYVIRWLLRQPGVALLPMVGDPTAVRVNLVPRDFVVDAIAHLSGLDRSAGKTYQLADPAPLTVDELLEEIGTTTRRRILRIPTLAVVAKAALDWVPGLQWLMEIPSTTIDYFVHPTHYTTDHARADLDGSGIAAPPFPSYLPRLIEFVRAHPEIDSGGMA